MVMGIYCLLAVKGKYSLTFTLRGNTDYVSHFIS